MFLENFYSMAIFSQNNENTKIDYRNNDFSKPNRKVPFNLPQKEKRLLLEFMKEIKVDVGSIDLILDKNNNFIFLELNPQGQIDWLSENCNYYIEELISKHLIKRYG